MFSNLLLFQKLYRHYNPFEHNAKKNYIWKSKCRKITYETLCKNYEQVGLKSIHIFSKIVSLQCSWIQTLYDNNFHKWKIVAINLLTRYLGKNFNFHSNLLVESSLIQNCPSIIKKYFAIGTNIFLPLFL